MYNSIAADLDNLPCFITFCYGIAATPIHNSLYFFGNIIVTGEPTHTTRDTSMDRMVRDIYIIK